MAMFPTYPMVTIHRQTGKRHATNQRRYALLGMAALLFAGCNTAPSPSVTTLTTGTATMESSNKTASTPTAATAAGHFLTARQALFFNDVETSAGSFLATLQTDTDNVNLLRQSFITQYYFGDIEKAAALGRQLESLNITLNVGREPAVALAITQQDWAAVLVFADSIAETTASIGLAGVIKGWALIANGQGDAGITALLQAGKAQPGDQGEMPHYIRLQAALMAEHLGNRSEALQRGLALAKEPLSMHIAYQLAFFLHRNGATDSATRLITERLSQRYDQNMILRYMDQNEPLLAPNLAQNIAAGILNAAVANGANGERQLLLARLRLALYIDPTNELGQYILAQQFLGLGMNDAVRLVLSNIDPMGPLGQPTLLAQYDLANDAEDFEQAARVINEASTRNPDSSYLYKLLGDALRRDQKFAQSQQAYLTAIERGYVTAAIRRNLAIAQERLGLDEAAEDNFLASLELNPDDPYTLNYLGYWWAEAGQNLDKAIELIEHAVALRPESGFFVDSLGWVHYQLGDYEKAVTYLETATMLEPAEAEITGHLGDVYWQLGREDEAQFKWRLALTLSSDEEERDALRARIETGLPKNE